MSNWYDVHPDDVPQADLNNLERDHLSELFKLRSDIQHSTGKNFKEATILAAREAANRFLNSVPEHHNGAWHKWHMDLIDNFIQAGDALKEDIANSMGMGGIADKAMPLGTRNHLIKRELIGMVLGKIRARAKTKRRK